MPRLFHPQCFIALPSPAKDLMAQVEYRKAETQVLWSRLPTRIMVTLPECKKLLKLGGKVGPALKHLVTVVEDALAGRNCGYRCSLPASKR